MPKPKPSQQVCRVTIELKRGRRRDLFQMDFTNLHITMTPKYHEVVQEGSASWPRQVFQVPSNKMKMTIEGERLLPKEKKR